MSRNAAYRELFTQTEARVIIPAAKNLMLITQKYDKAVAILDDLDNTEYEFVEVDRPETALTRLCAVNLVDQVVAERTRLEHEFRELLESKIERTKRFQMENLEGEITLNIQAVCQIIRSIECMAKYCREDEFDNQDTTDKIIEVIVTELFLNDCTESYFFYDNPDEEDDCYLDEQSIETAIAAVEDYLEGLKERARELRRDEAKEKEK